MALTFVEDIPAPANRPDRRNALVAELSARPGEWAILARGTRADRNRLTVRAHRLRTTDDRIEATVRTQDDEVILYARARAS